MNMQQMMIQAQKMQREMQKAQNELHEKEFSLNKGQFLLIQMKNKFSKKESKIKIDIDKDAFTPDDKEMVEDMIKMALNELYEQIDKAEDEIQSKVTGRSGGFGF